MEVKTASKKHNGDYWCLGAVSHLRLQDDFLGLVFDGRLYIESMEEHRDKTPHSGIRAVTSIVYRLRVEPIGALILHGCSL